MTEQQKQFVIQQHCKGDDLHWDMMLQVGDCLQTWRLDKEPKQVLKTPAEAIKIFDHPLKFLTYEGPVNRGQGQVKIVESGTYRIQCQTDEQIELHFDGKILNGKFTLLRLKDNTWQLKTKN